MEARVLESGQVKEEAPQEEATYRAIDLSEAGSTCAGFFEKSNHPETLAQRFDIRALDQG